MTSLSVGLVQMDSGPDLDANLKKAERLILQAVDRGAAWVLLPEVFNFRGTPEQMLAHREVIDGRSVSFVLNLAKRHRVWILIGSYIEAISNRDDKVYNTSVLLNPDGRVVSLYRKIHLFSATVSGKKISEPDTFLPGDTPVLTKIEGVPLGLSICYDLRFPELYLSYMKMGAKICTVPASFTHPTGSAHWEILCRSRAIDYRQYIVAPNQVGIGAGGVPSYGNSMIIDPWGRPLVRGDDSTEAVYMATLDLQESGVEVQPALNVF